MPDLAAGLGVSTSTARRYVEETVELLADRALGPRTALRRAKAAGHEYVILDGTLIAIDRVAADRPFYSGKHQRQGMNVQVVAGPTGEILWGSDSVPGSVHDMKAARIRQILPAIRSAGLIVLADKGYRSAAAAFDAVQGPKQARIAEGGQPRPRAATRPRRTRERAAQDLENTVTSGPPR